MKKIVYLMFVLAGIGLFASCGNEPVAKKKPAKKEVSSNSKKSNNSGAKKGSKAQYTWAKFWKSAKRKMAYSDAQGKQLKTAKEKFDNKVKGLGKKRTPEAVTKLRNEFYASIKKTLGETKGQQFINYMRRYKKKMRAEK